MSDRKRVSHPERALFILVSTQCDIACTYCFYTTGHEKRDRENLFSRNLDGFIASIIDLKFGAVILTGGDPLNRRDKAETIRLIDALGRNGIRVIVNTSAAYLTTHDCERLADARPFRVDVSIDSHDTKIHDGQRGRHDDAVATIRALSSLGVSVQTTTVVTEANASSLIETVRFLKACGASIQKLQPAFILTRPRAKDGRRSTGQLAIQDVTRAALSQLLTSPEERSYLSLWERYWGDGLDELPMIPRCRMGKSLFVCSSEGTISGCFHRPDVNLGNIFNDSTSQIESNIAMSGLHNEICPSCVGSHCVSLFDSPDSWIPRPAKEGASAE